MYQLIETSLCFLTCHEQRLLLRPELLSGAQRVQACTCTGLFQMGRLIEEPLRQSDLRLICSCCGFQAKTQQVLNDDELNYLLTGSLCIYKRCDMAGLFGAIMLKQACIEYFSVELSSSCDDLEGAFMLREKPGCCSEVRLHIDPVDRLTCTRAGMGKKRGESSSLFLFRQ